MAFSSESWKKIMERDHYSCRECNKTKAKGYTIVAAHILHNRDYPYYDSPSNGKALDIECHRRQHLRSQGKNGLTLEQNQHAIRKIEEKIAELKAKGKLV